MALKKYAYYTKGNKLALVQMDTVDVSAEDYGKYKSPTESVTDGIEIEYSYSPWYRINDTVEALAVGSGYQMDDASDTRDGLLRLNLSSDTFGELNVGDKILVKGASRINLIHTVGVYTTSTWIFTNTKYSGPAVTDTFEVYTQIEVLEDESFELDLTRYQSQALVYYIKAKMAEEAADIEQREYFMRLFNKQLEKSSSSRKRGINIVQGFGGMRSE